MRDKAERGRKGKGRKEERQVSRRRRGGGVREGGRRAQTTPEADGSPLEGAGACSVLTNTQLQEGKMKTDTQVKHSKVHMCAQVRHKITVF